MVLPVVMIAVTAKPGISVIPHRRTVMPIIVRADTARLAPTVIRLRRLRNVLAAQLREPVICVKPKILATV